jgi:hypothetical protein
MTQQTMDCSEARVSLGVYVLGAIDPAERATVDSHLATCRDCRDELAGLASLPALLAKVSTEEAIGLSADEMLAPVLGVEPPGEPPRELLGTVIDLTAARRRRRRFRNTGLSVAAAAAVIAAGAFGGVRLASGPAQTAQPPQAAAPNFDYGPGGNWSTATGAAAGMDGTVMYRQMGWGIQVAARVVGIPVGTTCEIYVKEADGTQVMAGGWTTDNREGTVWYPASSSVSAKQVRSFVITVSGHQPITVQV